MEEKERKKKRKSNAGSGNNKKTRLDPQAKEENTKRNVAKNLHLFIKTDIRPPNYELSEILITAINFLNTSPGRLYTVSVALPGSIISNAQNLQLKTYLAGQIGRAMAVFNVDEVIVFNESKTDNEIISNNDPNAFLCKLLQYLDTPQYLRKSLFPMQDDLKFAGLLNPIDAPHHMRMDTIADYREGIVIPSPGGKFRRQTNGSIINCGTAKNVLVDSKLDPGTRVTVKIDNTTRLIGKHAMGWVVPPSEPRLSTGTYWGYSVRYAESLSQVFTNSPHKGGYDLTIGTSERGTSIDQLDTLPVFRHLLIVFGGLNGLEYSAERDTSLCINDVSLLFQYYLNTCPKQGSGTIRTEEAILISMSSLRPLIESFGAK